MMTSQLLIAIPLFLIAGIFSGMLVMVYGFGGGVVLVPIIYFYLHSLGIAAAMQIAVGTSLLNVFAAAMLASLHHHKKRNIRWPITLRILPGIFSGTGIGLVLSHYLHTEVLKVIFIVFLLAVIINSYASKSFKQTPATHEYQQPSLLMLTAVGLMVGAFSVLVGIGGGLILTPYFRHLRMKMIDASASSASIAAVLALCGALGYIYLGYSLPVSQAALPLMLGFVSLPVFIAIQLGAFAGLKLGKKLNQHISDAARVRFFPWIVALMLLLMLI